MNVGTPSPQPARKRAFLSRRFPAAVEQRIVERYDTSRNPADTVLPAEELVEAAKGCDYLFVSAMENLNGDAIRQLAPELKAIATMSVGFNHIDLEAARDGGVAVFYSPGVLSDAVAELAVMLLLNAARRGYEADSMVRTNAWPGYAPTQLMGIGLVGRRAGILGMGRIGQAVAHRLRPFGVEIHYHNRSRLPQAEEGGATFHESADSLLRVSDFFLICAPGTTGLAGFLNRERIDLLPQNPIIVNVSRGESIEDDALIQALENGRVFAAGLDVFANEPNIDPRYRDLNNVFLTPHIGSATVDTRNAMGFILLDALEAFEAGRKADNQLC